MELADLLRTLDLHTFIAFDFETTGLDASNDRITEFAAVRFEAGVAVDSFESLVNPERPIPPEIVRKTGITDDMVKDAPTEDQIVEELCAFIGGHPIVAHNLPFDLAFLSNLKLKYLEQGVINEGYDTVPLSQAFLFFLPNHQLGTLGEYLGHSSDGTHRALTDTEILGELFLTLIGEAASYPLPVIQKILSAAEGKTFPNKTLYVNLANALAKSGNLKRALVQSNIEKELPSPILRYEGGSDSLPANAEAFFAEDGPLARSFAGSEYEVRESQIRYADFVEGILEDSAIGIVEAGTGLGKSLAYLMTALKTAVAEDGEPVVISCHTKPLQEQLFQREIPKLAAALGVSFCATLMKGRQNYVCKTRVDRVIAESRTLLSDADVQSLIVILVWLQWTRSGDLEECPGFLRRRPHRLRRMIQSEPGFCTSRVCKRAGGCFLGPLREATQEADIIVVNHSFLLYELESQNVLPSLKTVIIDEAHNLLKVGYSHFKTTLSHRIIADQLSLLSKSSARSKRIKGQIDALAGSMPEAATHHATLLASVRQILSTSDSLFNALSDRVSERYDRDAKFERASRIRILSDHFEGVEKKLSALSEALSRGSASAARLGAIVGEVPEHLRDAEMARTIERVSEVMVSLNQALHSVTEDQQQDWVYWETGAYRQDSLEITLNAVPVDIGPPLRTLVFEGAESVLTTSATLSLDSRFDYFIERFGLTEYEEKPVRARSFASPFFYEDQCTYLQWAGEVSPSSPDFVPLLAEVVEKLFDRFQKRMLVLFTSRAMLNDCFDVLDATGFTRRAPLLAQNGSRPALINQFRRTDNGILLGTSSFWEGIDLPGELLEILVIAKIPFDVPTEPVIEAYNEKIEESGSNAFFNHSVPAAAIRLRQGFGRLIRSVNDEGIFINMDNRVVNKRYGSLFQSVIPVSVKTFSEVAAL